MPTFITEPVPHAEAVKMIQGKTPVGQRVFAGMLPELRGRAFAVAGIEDAGLRQRIRDRIADLPQGGDWDTIREEIAQDLTPFYVDPQAGGEEMARQIAEADRRAELLVRTQGFQAYAATRYREQMENRDIQPFWQYKAFGDGRVRDTHRALDGLVFPAAHPFWDDHYPPWEWGCRCIVIGLSPEAVEEIRAEDEGKAPDQQRVIEGEFLKAVEERKSLPRGPNLTIDLRSPVDRADDARGKNLAYRWNPGELRPDLGQLKARYSPDVWAQFETFAKATDVGDGRTVWEWAQEKPTAQPVAATEPKPAEGSTAKGTAVRERLDLGNTPAAHKKVAERVLDVIGKIHGDGPLGKIPAGAFGKQGNRSLAAFYHDGMGNSRFIALKPRSATADFNVIHEIGHWIDHDGLGERKGFTSTRQEAELGGWWKAVEATQAYKDLKAAGLKSYWSSRSEMWARSYTQFIVERSGSKELAKQLADYRGTGTYSFVQWDAEDFAPVGKAIEALFRKKGWMQ